MPPVTVAHWNPRRIPALGPYGGVLGIGPRVNNFGDLLGPLVVERLRDARDLRDRDDGESGRLLAVGSILHRARTGDTIWGAGVNLKVRARMYRFGALDVRAVRGPLTRHFLEERGIAVPEVYGDPGLLVPHLIPALRDIAADKKYDVTIVPNFHDVGRHSADDPRVLDPRLPVMTCLERIARSRFVIGSSLHGTVIAESLGIPARFVSAGRESPVKYADYYNGTGRTDVDFAHSVDEAIEMGGAPGPVWDPQPLLDAFPEDLWQPRDRSTSATSAEQRLR